MTNWVKLVLVLTAAFAVSALVLSLSNKFRLPVTFFIIAHSTQSENLAIGIAATFAIYFTINGFIFFTYRDTLTNKAKSLAWLKSTFDKGDIGSRYGQAFMAMLIFWPGS